jgi:hypothetical protein
VHKISIVPRGRALGFTLNLPAEDRYLKTREELLDYMTVLMGGRVAEQVVFGAITTGASDDLKRVADISHSMVHDYAMGTAGVGRSPDGDVRLSEQTLRMRDEERQELIGQAGGPETDRRPPAPSRCAGQRAARTRGARAGRDRTDHGGRPAHGAGARVGPAGGGGGQAPRAPRRAQADPPPGRHGVGRAAAAIDCRGCSAASITWAWPSRR